METTNDVLENVLKIMNCNDLSPIEERLFAARAYVLSLLNKIETLRDSDDEDTALAIVSGKWPQMPDDKDWEAHAHMRKLIAGINKKRE